MNQKHSPNTSASERALNAALVNADISNSYEEYMSILDRFYADDVEAVSEAHPGRLTGKARLVPVLMNFLIPLHVLAEIGGLSVSLACSALPGDQGDELHAEWTLLMTGTTGRTVTARWTSARRWQDSRVIHERHYDEHGGGETLTLLDLDFRIPEQGRVQAVRPS